MSINEPPHRLPVPVHALNRARQMRRDMTPPERRLWQALRGRRLQGAKFTRQYPIGDYIVDFVSRHDRLVIEVDGDEHGRDDRVIADRARTVFLEQRGYRVLRFWNAEVLGNLERILEVIAAALAASSEAPRL
jgi:very-short-patch-repair endonuclease